MRIRFLFYLLILFLFLWGGGLVLSLYLADASERYGYVAGVGLVLLVVYLLIFYRRIVRPLNAIAGGMELLREQDFSSRLSKVGQYEADRIIEIFNRMMEQLKHERLRLREQNHFLDLLVNASPMGIVIATFDGQVSQANPASLKMMGVRSEEILGVRLQDIHVPLAVELARMAEDDTAIVRLGDANIYKCTRAYFIDCGYRHPFYLIERMTDEVRRAEKRAYEKVIRMIAHEVNNTVAGITSTLDVVEQELASRTGMDDMRSVMKVCIERCFTMSHFITRFAEVVKIPNPHKLSTPLNPLVAKCAGFMDGFCRSKEITLQVQLDDKVGAVLLDADLFEQVLVNIMKNSLESISSIPCGMRPSAGVIKVCTVAPACVEICDNGPGIGKEAEDKLFSPFFSTKPHGQGIGLMFIREVLENHGCTFSLQTSDEDGLTRFRISFGS